MYQCRCTTKNFWWWAERLPETCRVVIPIKFEFSASVCFIHKEFVTMHGHTILKYRRKCLLYINFEITQKLIQLPTIHLVYFKLLAWICPSELKIFCQIRDIRLTGCAGSNLFPLLLYHTQLDDKRKIFLNQQCRAMLANNQLDALFHIFIYFISLHVSSITVLIIRRSNCINL